MKRKIKALISAYACNPSGSLQLHPGEDLTGWMLTQQISHWTEAWVLTHSYNKKGIASELGKYSPQNVHFIFVTLPRIFGWLYHIGVGERLYYYLWQITAWREARRLNKLHRFDIAHHLTFGNYWMPSFIGAFLPVPFIWGPVGGGQKTPAPLFSRYSLLGQFAEIGRDFAQWLGRNLLISRHFCLRRASVILVCNKETKINFPRKYWGRIQYFPVNGISRDDVTPNRSVSRQRIFWILTAGRLIRLKGFDICIEAFARFIQEHPDSILDIVGQGPEESRLRKLVDSKGLEDRIRFIPWMERRDLIKKMSESDLFLFSSFRDGGGAVVVEAMANGLPVICLDTGGPGFHVNDDCGIKIKPQRGDRVIHAMSLAMKRLKESQHLRESMGRKARKRALEFYVWDNLGARLKRIYFQVLENPDLEDLS